MMVMDEWTASVYTFSAERLTVNAPFNFKKYSITPLPTPQYKTGRLLIKNKNSNKTQQIPTKQQKKSTTSSKKKRFLEHLEMKKKIPQQNMGGIYWTRKKKRREKEKERGREIVACRVWRPSMRAHVALLPIIDHRIQFPAICHPSSRLVT